MQKRYDVIISGAGPCGSLLGYLLADEGINTLIIEKKEFPRYKICAGGLQHRVLELIPYKLNGVVQRAIYGIRFSLKAKNSFVKKYHSPIMYTVNRTEFDDFLAKKACNHGAAINFSERVRSYDCRGEEIRVITDKDVYDCRVLVGADGIRGSVHQGLTGNASYLKILGYEIEKEYEFVKSGFLDDYAGLDFGGVRNGYCWVFPKKNMISCGIGGPLSGASDLRNYFKWYLGKIFNSNGSIRHEIMAQSIPVRQRYTPLHGYRVLAIGDAACLGDGFTGEGLYNGFRSSLIALKAIKNALRSSDFGFGDYAKEIDREIYSDIRISLKFSKIFYKYPLFFYKLLKSHEMFFNLSCKIMRGEKKYSDIYRRIYLFRHN